MSNETQYDLKEIAKHRSKDDLWIIVHGTGMVGPSLIVK